MSTIAIGDIHGNSAALDDLLDQLAGRLHPHDTVVFLGDYIDVEEPMLIPVGEERKVVLEVPAHRVDDLSEGQSLNLWIPALDRRPRDGRIASIARAVVRSATAEPGDTGLGSRVVPVTVVFTLTPDELARVPLGSTVHVDL